MTEQSDSEVRAHYELNAAAGSGPGQPNENTGKIRMGVCTGHVQFPVCYTILRQNGQANPNTWFWSRYFCDDAQLRSQQQNVSTWPSSKYFDNAGFILVFCLKKKKKKSFYTPFTT